MEGAGIVRGREHIEGIVLFQRAAGVKIEAAEIETRGRDPPFDLIAFGVTVDSYFTLADPVPDGSDAEGERPVSGILPDRRIAVVHKLIAVVFELLAEIVEHRPTFMTSRDRKSTRLNSSH